MSSSSDIFHSDGEGGEQEPNTPRTFMNLFYVFGTNDNVSPTQGESPPPLLTSDNEGCTSFHIACQEANSLEELQSKFDAASLKRVQPSTGKNCLHFLTLNSKLILSIKGGNRFNRQIMKSIDLDKASHLVDFIVDRICLVEDDERCLLLEPDLEGRIPFQEFIENWISRLEESEEYKNGRRSIVGEISGLATSPGLTTSTSYGADVSPSQSQLLSSKETHHALLSLYLLSQIMERLKRKIKKGEVPFIEWRNNHTFITEPKSSRRLLFFNTNPTTSGSISNINRSSLPLLMVFEKISEIKSLLKSLLTVMTDKDEREAFFSLFLIKNLMLRKNNVGPWIVDMLDSPFDHTRTNVIDYLKRLSTLTEQKRTDSDDSRLYDLEGKLGRLHGLIPSMMSLSTRMTEKASTIPLITRALDKKMRSPFVSCVLFFDISILFTLLIAFRRTVITFMRGIAISPGAYYLANAAIFYFVLRIWGRMISRYYYSKRYKLLQLRFSKIWGVLNTSSVLLSWFCVWFIRYIVRKDIDVDISAMRVLIAVTTLLLWLNLIEALSVINVKLATFLLAIRKITREIFWYIFLLAGFGSCSSQVLYTLMMSTRCQDWIGNDVPAHCYPRFYYSKLYATVLGLETWGFQIEDVESPTFHRTLFSEITYGILSFIIIILLFNALIAVISDSYDSCLLQSKKLFGRTRIQFLGDTLAFQNLFVNFSRLEQQRWSHGGFTFLISSGILFTGFVLFELLVINEPNIADKNWAYVSFAINAWIGCCFNVILAQQVEARAKRRFVGICTRAFLKPIALLQWTVHIIQGVSLSYIDSDDGPEAWSGRVSYLKSEMNRVGEENRKEIWSLRSQMMQSESDVVKRLEKILQNQQSELLGRLEALEERQRRLESNSS